jgi:hypothetical protein
MPDDAAASRSASENRSFMACSLPRDSGFGDWGFVNRRKTAI